MYNVNKCKNNTELIIKEMNHTPVLNLKIWKRCGPKNKEKI